MTHKAVESHDSIPQTRIITESALLRRINRQLVKDGDLLRKRRGEYIPEDIGRYYVNSHVHVDPVVLGRSLGVLANDEMCDYVGMQTPWGEAEKVKKVVDGFLMVETLVHGGVLLSPGRLAQVPYYMRLTGGWYEEDCEWSIPFVVFESELAHVHDDIIARKFHVETFHRFFPQSARRFFGV